MTRTLSAAGFDWGDAGQGGERGIVTKASMMGPADQQLRSHDRADARLGEQGRSSRRCDGAPSDFSGDLPSTPSSTPLACPSTPPRSRCCDDRLNPPSPLHFHRGSWGFLPSARGVSGGRPSRGNMQVARWDDLHVDAHAIREGQPPQPGEFRERRQSTTAALKIIRYASGHNGHHKRARNGDGRHETTAVTCAFVYRRR